nr:MAG TPA: hypothetical protein [Bacteriophage sp.]
MRTVFKFALFAIFTVFAIKFLACTTFIYIF